MPDLEDFVRQFVAGSPALKPLLQQHSADYLEILPHVFLSELANWALTAWQVPERRAVVEEVLRRLEAEFAEGAPRIKEFIATGFLESLPPPGTSGQEISRQLGPQLRAEWESPGTSFGRNV